MMTGSTPEANEAVARLLYARDGYAPWETEDPNEQETYRIQAADLVAAALPHLRVQETPGRYRLAWLSARRRANQTRRAAQFIARHAQSQQLIHEAIAMPLAAQTPVPRPVDREALLEALVQACWKDDWMGRLADTILALLPTDGDTKGEGS